MQPKEWHYFRKGIVTATKLISDKVLGTETSRAKGEYPEVEGLVASIRKAMAPKACGVPEGWSPRGEAKVNVEPWAR